MFDSDDGFGKSSIADGRAKYGQNEVYTVAVSAYPHVAACNMGGITVILGLTFCYMIKITTAICDRGHLRPTRSGIDAFASIIRHDMHYLQYLLSLIHI